MQIVNWLAYPFYRAWYGLTLREFYEIAINSGKEMEVKK